MKQSLLKDYIIKTIQGLKNDCNIKYVTPNDFIKDARIKEDEVIKALDEMTDYVERFYSITCPDCCDEVAIKEDIPTQIITYVCHCGVKFELKLKHVSLVYKIKKTA